MRSFPLPTSVASGEDALYWISGQGHLLRYDLGMRQNSVLLSDLCRPTLVATSYNLIYIFDHTEANPEVANLIEFNLVTRYRFCIDVFWANSFLFVFFQFISKDALPPICFLKNSKAYVSLCSCMTTYTDT